MTLKNNVFLKFGVSLGVIALSLNPVHANPVDPTVQAGNVTFQSSGNTLNIHQSSDKAIIDWRAFDIGIDEHTAFHQPDSNSFTLNRVRGTDPSHIDGSLTANGRIAIINQNGVYFGGGAQVDVGSIIVSTADIANEDFMSGNYNFSSAGHPDARIVNAGHITARDAGLVGLVAPSVENNGVIEAHMGKVILAAGDTFALDFAGDGLINVAVSDDLPLRHHSARNNGVLRADGGRVVMTAAAARDTVDNLVVNTGVIEARSVGMQNGKIILGASGSNNTSKTGNSTVLNEGTLDASGRNAGEAGGEVELIADHVGLMAGSTIDVSGDQGGGQALIGGDYQGAGDQTALRTYVDQDAFIRADAITAGDGGRVIVWADDTNRYYGNISATGGAESGNGGFAEVSGKNWLDFNGHVNLLAANGDIGTLLLDPTDIVISNAANSNVSGSSPFQPVASDVASNLNVTTLQNALASASVVVQTIAAGSQQGNITVNDAISWSANNSLTLSAHNRVIINASITARNSLIITAADVEINANLVEHASGATLVFQPNAAATTIGVAGGTGAFNLSAADLNFIQNGWNSITIGRADGTGVMDVGARTWNVPLSLRSTTGEIQINGAQTMGANALTITTRNLSLNANLSGTGALTIAPDTNISVGLAGAAGTLNLTVAELDRIQDGFSGITIGRSNSTQNLTANAYTWRDSLTLQTGNASLVISGDQTMAAGDNLALAARTITLNADLIGTGTLSLRPDTNRTVGVAGGAGTFQVTNDMLDRVDAGWNLLNIGLTSNNQAMTVNSNVWSHNVQFNSGSGVITIAGDQDVGSNNLTIRSDSNTAINADLIGTGTLTISQISDSTTLGLAGAAGTVNLSVAELDRIQDGWGQLVFGHVTNDAVFTANAYTWRDNVTFRGDNSVITIDGDQDFGANNFTLHADAGPSINAALIGTGTLTFETDAVATTIGLAGGAGTFNIDATELGYITDGWSQIIFGRTDGTGVMTVNAHTWDDDLRLQSLTGAITIAGAQDLGDNDLEIFTNNLAIGATLTGSGELAIRQQTANATMGLAGGAGTLNLTTAELNNISNGWEQIIFGRSDGTGVMTVNTHTWNDDVKFQSLTGAVTISGAQNLGTNNLDILTNNLAIGGALNGTGDLTIQQQTADATMGLAGGAGTLNLTTVELNNISNGWSEIFIGRADSTAAVNVNAHTWNDNLTLRNGSGLMTIAGAQNLGANNLTIESDNLTVGAALTGTGILNLRAADAASSIGLAGGAGTLNLTTAELDYITNGWDEIVFGRADGTGEITVGAYANWRDDVRFLKDGSDLTNSITIAGNQSAFAGANTNFIFEGNTVLGANISSDDGDIQFMDSLILSTNALIDSGTGHLSFDGTLDGSFDLQLSGSGDITFGDDVGISARLGHLLLDNPGSVTSAGALRVASYTQTAGGSSSFAGAGLDATGAVNIAGSGITGTLAGSSGVLDSGAGTIEATVSFDALDISGAGATLLAGYIGTPGSPSQSMANKIRIDGVLLPSPTAAFTFAGFRIGYVEPVPEGPVIPPNINIANVVTSSYGGNNSGAAYTTGFVPQSDSPVSEIFTLRYMESGQKPISIIDGLLFMHPEIQDDLEHDSLVEAEILQNL